MRKALFVAYFASTAATRVCDPMLPALSRTFGVGMREASATISAYAIAYGLLQLLCGPLGDRFGKCRVVGWAALGCAAANAAAFAAVNLGYLVAARAFSGAAAAAITPLVLAWIGDTVPYATRQVILARFVMASLLGTIIGQWIAGVMTEWLGWRSVFALLTLLFASSGATVHWRGAGSGEPAVSSMKASFASTGRILSQPWARWILLLAGVEGVFAFGALAFVPSHLVHSHGVSLSAASGIVASYALGGLGGASARGRIG